MFKIINNITPQYLSKRFTRKETKYAMRNSGSLYMDRPNTEYKRRSSSYRGANLWKSLDRNIKGATDLLSFKQQYLSMY